MRAEIVEALTQAEFVKITPAQEELVARATRRNGARPRSRSTTPGKPGGCWRRWAC
jgi:hypothetical protein